MKTIIINMFIIMTIIIACVGLIFLIVTDGSTSELETQTDAQTFAEIDKFVNECSKERHALKMRNIELESELKRKDALFGSLKGELEIYKKQALIVPKVGFDGVNVGLFGGSGFLNDKAIPFFGIGVGVSVK